MSTDRFERVICQPGVRGLYESHYLKAHGGGRRTFWIKYCVLSPRDPREPVETYIVASRRSMEGAFREPSQRRGLFEAAR